MIFGSFDTKQKISASDFEKVVRGESHSYGEEIVHRDPAFSVYVSIPNLPVVRPHQGVFQTPDKKQVVCFYGNVFNLDEILNELGEEKSGQAGAEWFLKCFNRFGTDCFSKINGNFQACVYDARENLFILAHDHLGVEPIYYAWNGNRLIFSDSLRTLVRSDKKFSHLNPQALYTYLLFNYNPGTETFFRGIKKLRGGHFIQIKNGTFEIRQYWRPSFKVDPLITEESVIPELFDLFKDAVKIRLEGSSARPGVFVSGGMDSSSVLGLMRSLMGDEAEINTFSFRCKGKSFDESHYAQIMADAAHTNHHLIEYPADEVENIPNLVEWMEEPFSDLGIELATYILARGASGKVDYILTGDGGDELFAGHPVYFADKVAQIFDRIPGFVRQPMTALFQMLPDTDAKKSLPVKLKRFSYSANFPADLFSNRWRVYYTESELRKIVTPDFWETLKNYQPFKEIKNLYKEADGEDYLSKSLYGDYFTVVTFYLNRMRMIRNFQIEPRFPMLDYRLVELTAKIPIDLKIKGSESKYILHKAMEGFLPDEIVFRKDKLGHSVPMKNWMRESEKVKGVLSDVLFGEKLKQRGLFQTNYLRSLFDEHQKKRYNHSHRLWSVAMLELWLEKNFDQ